MNDNVAPCLIIASPNAQDRRLNRPQSCQSERPSSPQARCSRTAQSNRSTTDIGGEGHATSELLRKPTVDDMIDTIIQSGNTAAGIDGIPFEAYKVLAAQAGPVLFRVLECFMEGGLPDADFNDGLLFLLPKKDTLLARDTRPISVGNTDTRLVAKCLLKGIIEYVVDPSVLHPAQKGSIPGRVGLDHVTAASNLFYQAVESGHDAPNLFGLFIDTRKAFDSLHHDFIFAVLRHKGFPTWTIQAVRALLHEVKVTPFFGVLTDTWLRIERGVKQGCPLSPILFALCMDPLIRRLYSGSTGANQELMAYVDDLQAYTGSLEVLSATMRAIDQFSAVSGLGINRDKTVVIQAKSQELLQAWVDSRHCPWGGPNVPAAARLKVQDRYKALGFVIGRDVTTVDVFAGAIDKMRERVTAYKPVLRRLRPTLRYHVYNFFVAPLITYVAQAYSIPVRQARYDYEAVRDLAALTAIPFAGRAFRREQAFVLGGKFGVPNPLRDPWATSVSTLAARADLDQFHGMSHEQLLDLGHYQSMQYDIMVQANGRDAAAWWVYNRTPFGPNPPVVTFDSAAFTELTLKKRRALLYAELVQASAWEAMIDDKVKDWLGKRGVPNDDAALTNLNAHFANFGNLQANIKLHQFYMPLNAVSTDERVRHFKGRAKHDSTCHLCGTSDDHIDHIYGQCAVAVRARSRFGRLIQYDLSPDGLNLQSELEVAHLSFPATYIPQSVAVAICNWAAYMRGRTHPWPQFEGASSDQGETRRWLNARGIADLAVRVWQRHRLETWRPPLQPPIVRGAGNQTHRARNDFGASGRRTQLQKRLASEEAARLVAEAKSAGHIIAFTDGSVLDNPDPAYGGAAAIVIFPPAQRTTGLTVEAEVPLGTGVGNNFAETWATGIMLQIVLEACKHRSYLGVPVMHCTDSRNTAALVTCRAAPRAHMCLAHTVRRMAHLLNADNPLDCNWIAGHADIPLNVQVDEAAKRAASRSRDHPQVSVDTQRLLEQGLFALPRHISRTRYLGRLPRQGVG